MTQRYQVEDAVPAPVRRSAISGRSVTAAHAKRHPQTTVKETRASKFAGRFIKEHPATFHELSKR